MYFFASYSLYVAPCFFVVNKHKAPSHLLSAPKPEETNSPNRPLSEGLEGGAFQGHKQTKPGADPFSLTLPFLPAAPLPHTATCLQEAGTHQHQEWRIKWQSIKPKVSTTMSVGQAPCSQRQLPPGHDPLTFCWLHLEAAAPPRWAWIPLLLLVHKSPSHPTQPLVFHPRKMSWVLLV